MLTVTLGEDLWVSQVDGELVLSSPAISMYVNGERTGAGGIVDPPPYRVFRKGTRLGLASYIHVLTGDGTWVTCKHCGGGWPTPTTASRSVCG